MLKLYFVKAGDEMNNMDAFVWATDVHDAKREWLASEWGDLSDLDRIWEVPTLPPSQSGMVEWPEPAYQPTLADLDAANGMEIVTYAHELDPDGQRFRALKSDALPAWAVGVQDEKGAL